MTSTNISRKWVGVVGAGSFGIAVANLLAQNAAVLLYVRKKATVQQKLVSTGSRLHPNVGLSYDLEELAKRCKVIFPVVPAEGFREMMQQLAPWLRTHHILIHGTKGLDVRWPHPPLAGSRTPLTRERVKTMSEVIQETSVVHQIGCLAGPNLARELAQGQPAATVVASPTEAVITQGRQLLRSDRFQVYSSTDLLGVELCGVLKNIIAIGAGCLSGLGYGENARGLLISRGIVEMISLGSAMGASVRSFLGLAGIGDLVATCTSKLSRNYIVGCQLAQGTKTTQFVPNKGETAEGIRTLQAISSLVEYYQIHAPITETIYQMLFEGLDAREAVHTLMQCPSGTDVEFI